MSASGSLAHRKILPDISSKSRTLWVMLWAFTTKHALFKIIYLFSYKIHVLPLKKLYEILYGSHGDTVSIYPT